MDRVIRFLNRMRVLYFSRESGVHDIRFLRAIKRSGAEVWFLGLREGPLANELASLGVKLASEHSLFEGINLKLPDLLSAAPVVEEVIRRVRPDVVHAGPVLDCGLLAALSIDRTPLVAASWGFDLLMEAAKTPLNRWAATFTLRSADRVLVDCDTVREVALDFVPELGDRFVQFPWGTDPQVFDPDGPIAPLTPSLRDSGGVVFISNRNWEPGYEIQTLAKGFSMARSGLEAVRLLLLGGGSLRSDLDVLLEGQDDSVERVGVVSSADMPTYLRAADIFVSTSPSDGSSVSLLEAMSCALPVIVTDNSGNREWVRHGENGWLVPSGDPGALASAMREAVAAGPERWLEMGRRNRETILLRGVFRENVGRLLDAYQELTHDD